MNAKEAYKARKEIEESGVWCELVSGSVKLRAASGRNKEFARLIKGFNQNQRISDDVFFDKMRDVCAKSIVIDWEGFDVDYSEQAFIDTCDELKDCGFLEDVISMAMDKDMFNAVARAQAEKN
jgi:hypothetical protein